MAGIWRRKRAKRDVWMVDYCDISGVRHRLTAKTREQAENLLADKIKESRDAAPATTDQELTIGDYAARWLDAVAADLKPRTVASYRQLFRLHIQPAFGTMKLREVQRAHVKSIW